MVPTVKPTGSSRRESAAVVGLGAVLLAALLGSACQSPSGVELCGEIPEGGCPAGRGGSCDDLVCTGLYDCVEGAWTELEHCPGGGTTAASTSAQGQGGAGGGEGAGGCAIAEIDHSGEAEDCTPDLLEPDCPAVAAEVCTPCETGCADFFLCTDDGWIDVAACEEDGTFVIVPR